MPYDADAVQSLIQSRLAESGVDVSGIGPNLALEIGQRVQQQLEDIVARLTESVTEAAMTAVEQAVEQAVAEAAPAPAAPSPEFLTSMLRAVESIDAGKTQVDILKALLIGSADHCRRVALFIVKGDKGIGWLAQGFGVKPPFTDDNVKKVSIPLTADTFFRSVFGEGKIFRGPGDGHGDNGKFFERLGGFVPMEAIAVPLVIKGKVVAILYGDGGSEVASIDGADAVAALVHVASMSIKLIPLKGQPQESGEMMGRLAGVGGLESSGSFKRPEAPRSVEIPSRPVPAPAAAPAPVAPPPRPRAAASPIPGAASMNEEERKLHEEARRFARLLVSEIKLYNEAKVAVGKRNRDLYERLKEDIERSRQMYNDRYPAKITSTTNYFFEELVAQLADGDRAALGI